jgi:hypothetical protein
LTEQGVRITTTNYKITANQEKIAVEANSYYVNNLNNLWSFMRTFILMGGVGKDIWDRRKLPLPDDKVNPTQYAYVINFKGFAIRILNNS